MRNFLFFLMIIGITFGIGAMLQNIPNFDWATFLGMMYVVKEYYYIQLYMEHKGEK